MCQYDQKFIIKKYSVSIMVIILLAALFVTGCGAKDVPSVDPSQVAGNPKEGAHSEPPVANSIRVAAVSGQVAFLRTGEAQDWIPAVSGMQLALADTLTTEVASETDLDVDQDKHVLVGEKVRMVIETLLQTVNQSKVARLRVDTGALYIRIQRKLATDEAFEVITPTCVMGVRGTEFVVAASGGDTQIFVMEGNVQVALNPKDLDKNKGIPYGNTLPAASWISVASGQMLEVPWGTDAISKMLPISIDFNKIPIDMLKALEASDSDKLTPYRSAIEDANQARGAALEAAGTTPESPFKDVPALSESPYVDPSSGHVYARIDLDLTFDATIKYCEEKGGHLMTITSEEEQALAEAMIAKGSRFWYLFGLVQKPGSIEPNQGFEWVTGEAVDFTRWHQENGSDTEPSDVSGTGQHENQVLMLNLTGNEVWKLGDWNDMNLVEQVGEYGFLCEWESADQFYGIGSP